jgi:hypothetical protein
VGQVRSERDDEDLSRGELCHWEIVGVMAENTGDAPVKQLADWAVPVQREHIETVRRAALELAVEEASA